MIDQVTEQGIEREPSGSPILVIGYGNALRRDDGAGLALAEGVAAYFSSKGIAARLILGSQLVPEMALAIAEAEPAAVLFVDTAAHEACGGIQIVPIAPAVTPSMMSPSRVSPEEPSPTLGHQLAPALVLILAALLYDSHPRAWLVTISGVDFAHGEGFSEGVAKLLNDVPVVGDRLLQMIQHQMIQ